MSLTFEQSAPPTGALRMCTLHFSGQVHMVMFGVIDGVTDVTQLHVLIVAGLLFRRVGV